MLYELGLITTQTATTSPILEIIAGTGKPMSILEFGTFNNAATASTFVLGRPGNTPTTGTITLASEPLNQPPGGGASVGGIAITGWGTAPTAPAAGNTLRRFNFAASVGNGVVFSWAPGELIIDPTRTGSLVLWSLSTVAAQNVYVKWTE